MIPDFDLHGNLPPGVHPATIDEVVERFGGPSLSRRKRTEALCEFYDFARPFTVRLYVDGSYVTQKLSPNDVDIALVLTSTFQYETTEGGRLRDRLKLKRRDRLDVFPYIDRRDERECWERVLGWMSDRELNPKGIICVEVRDDQERRPVEESAV